MEATLGLGEGKWPSGEVTEAGRKWERGATALEMRLCQRDATAKAGRGSQAEGRHKSVRLIVALSREMVSRV